MGGAPYVYTFYVNGIHVNYGNPRFIARPEFTQAILDFLKEEATEEAKSGKLGGLVYNGGHKGTPVEDAIEAMRQSMFNGVAFDSMDFEFGKVSETYIPEEEEKQ